VTPLAVTLSAPSLSKVYDGLNSYTTTTADLTAAGANLVGGDTLSSAVFVYQDVNAGSNKAVTLSSATVNDGNNGANYTVTLAGNTSSEILEDRLTGIPLLIVIQYAQRSPRGNRENLFERGRQNGVTLKLRERAVKGRQFRLVTFSGQRGVLINCASGDNNRLPQCVAFQ
jgi:hypothetical protein